MVHASVRKTGLGRQSCTQIIVSLILPAVAGNTVARTQPLPVEEDLAALGNLTPCLLTGFVTALVFQLLLEGAPEALDRRVVDG